jgi:hypothetical protein
MPKTLAKMLPVFVGLVGLGLGVTVDVFAGGVRVGNVETRVATLEQCASNTVLANTAQDERLRQVETAVATIPAMAEDIREMRAQVTQILTLLATTHQPDRS